MSKNKTQMNNSEKEYLESLFPKLRKDNKFKITSSSTCDYNCIAWAVGKSDCWYWPPLDNEKPESDEYWPQNVPNKTDLGTFIKALETDGYEICKNSLFEDGCTKIALYAIDGEITHAARQLDNGLWTSKLGPLNDIQHGNPEVIEGGFYGKVAVYMKKKNI
jgi:hypothetical protein